ncbi:LexA family transcriptional regulator [Kaustia mangrovi]|uniref:LexA family transcriptional regulator n=1 Tax=Kaustia mangrovi TaxID=2593653 RepID=UPI003CCDF292
MPQTCHHFGNRSSTIRPHFGAFQGHHFGDTLQPMETKGKFPNGLAPLMRRHGDGPTSLARKIGTSKQNVIRWRDESRKVPREMAEKIAVVYGVSAAEIMLPSNDAPLLAPLISWVSAGELLSADHTHDFGDAPHIPCPGLDPMGEWIALRVEGDSMDRISPPDSVIFVNLRDRNLVANGCYIISNDDGASGYKRWRPNPERWEAVSTNPAHEPKFVLNGSGPRIIGRVRRTMLDM